MIKSARLLIFSIFLFCIISGCSTNPDPAKGGFLDGIDGLATGKYENRQKAKEAELDEAEKSNIELDEKKITLQEKHEALEKIRQTYEADLEKITKEVNQLEIKLIRVEVRTKAELTQKRKLVKELTGLKEKIKQESKYIDSHSEKQMREELNRLVKDKNRLQKQIIELTSM